MFKKVKTKREQWSGQLSFILASTGASVGLGNIWKLPYMAGSEACHKVLKRSPIISNILLMAR